MAANLVEDKTESSVSEPHYVPLRNGNNFKINVDLNDLENKSQMTSMSAGSSVYSLTRHNDKARRKELRKKLKSEAKSTKVDVIAESREEEEAVPTVSKEEEEKVEMEALHMISSCISSMSVRYEQMGVKLTKKLDELETTSQRLNDKFKALEARRREDTQSEMMNLPTIDATQTEHTTVKKERH